MKDAKVNSATFKRGDAKTDILIVGGGTGGCAAAMAATSLGRKVIMTEETDWIGGQLTAQAVPPDEHTWIEQFGCTARYRDYRNLVRKYYKDNYPLTVKARKDRWLNPGNGYVSRLCHDFRVGLAVLQEMLAPVATAGLLEVRLKRKAKSVETDGDRFKAVKFTNLETGEEETIEALYILDATELGDLLPMGKVEYVTGFESQKETGEPHAVPGQSQPDNVQAISWVFAMGYDPKGDHRIRKPEQYNFWKGYIPPTKPPWPFPLFNWNRPVGTSGIIESRVLFSHETDDPRKAWFHWRRVIYSGHYPSGFIPYDVVAVIWTQNDYMNGNLIDKPEDEVERYLEESRQQSLSFLYWMQTDAPRPDGGTGYPGLYLAPDVVGTEDGLAKYPYIREARRIKALFTVTENHIGAVARGKPEAEYFYDTVGVGSYHIDLHYSTAGTRSVEFESLPFQIPLGALIPVRVENMLPACKNLGVTHLTNGAYRLHPVEWNIGEAAGLLAGFCLDSNIPPRGVRENRKTLREFQDLCLDQGFELEWPRLVPEDALSPFDKRVLGYLPVGALPRREWEPPAIFNQETD